MPKKSAIKTSLFAAEEREQKLDRKGDLLSTLNQHVNFAALAAEIDHIAPRPSDKRGGRPPYPTELMVRILVLQHLYNLSDEALEYQFCATSPKGYGGQLDEETRQKLPRLQTQHQC